MMTSPLIGLQQGAILVRRSPTPSTCTPDAGPVVGRATSWSCCGVTSWVDSLLTTSEIVMSPPPRAAKKSSVASKPMTLATSRSSRSVFSRRICFTNRSRPCSMLAFRAWRLNHCLTFTRAEVVLT